ncbi:MAG TPA: hypothetical protein VE223_07615 [Nitrososphaeraceae archaeon]|nr:hypothetical protein [Nitrososphaeraceae archaeon]
MRYSIDKSWNVLGNGKGLVSQNGSYGNAFYRKILLAYNSIFMQFPCPKACFDTQMELISGFALVDALRDLSVTHWYL